MLHKFNLRRGSFLPNYSGLMGAAFLAIVFLVGGLSADQRVTPTRVVSIYFIDRDRVVDEADTNADYGEIMKLKRFIIDAKGTGYQPILFHEGRVTGPFSTAQTGKTLDFYREETNEDGQLVYLLDFTVDLPSVRDNMLLVVDRSPEGGPTIRVIGLADLLGNEGLLFCNFSGEQLFVRIGNEDPVALQAGEIRYLSANRSREGNVIGVIAARMRNGEMEIFHNTFRRLRRNSLSVAMVIKPSEDDHRVFYLNP